MRRKKCPKCGEIKDVGAFAVSTSASDGRQSYCKLCRKGLQTKRFKENVEFRLAHHIARRIQDQLGEACPADIQTVKVLEKALGYRIANLKKYLDRDLKAREDIVCRHALDMGYHLDHRIPLSSFGCTTIEDNSFQRCWAKENLRFIPAAENLAKGASLDWPH